ncbi:MAG TPA: tetratricopeptide repeat protein [Verrucomicrobiae bacterium]|nr:tetratricopeptide repeat protein [Verrucomicrobiae bacterium]
MADGKSLMRAGSGICGAAVIVLLTVAAYFPVFRAGFIWDDDAHVINNQTLRSLDGLEKIWIRPGATQQYYPLVYTSFWLEYHLWKLHPVGYHLVNVLLHAANAVLLWRLLRRLEIPGAWWTAALFALHPVQVESVAWITERKNVLSGLFYLLATLAYLRCRPLTKAVVTPTRPGRYYWLALVLFACALLSKTVTCSLPAMLLLLTWWKAGRVEKPDAWALAPLFVLGAGMGLFTAWIERYRLGASGPEWALSFGQRCLIAGRVPWFYAGKLFWPHDLTFIYPRWDVSTGAAWQYLFPLATVVVLAALWLARQSIGRGPLVGVLFFLGTLAPALGFLNVYPFRYSFVADHFQYVASIGLMAVAAGAGATVAQRAGPVGVNVGALSAGVVLLALGMITWVQTHIYQDQETLWRDTLTKNPGCWLADNNLGLLLFDNGKIAEAIQHYEQAVQDEPDYVEAHNNLGVALGQVGKFNEAIACYERALRIKPDYADAHNNLGFALAQVGRVQEAIDHWQQALRFEPGFAQAHNNWGNALFQEGKLEDAIRHYERAISLKPDYPDAHYNLGLALARLGRVAEAIGHWEQALRIKPDYADAHYNLGVALERMGRTQEAIGHYEQALRINPDFAEAKSSLLRLQAGR